MAATTTSGIDLIVRLFAPIFLLQSGLVAAYLHVLGHFSLKCSHYKATPRHKISKSDSQKNTLQQNIGDQLISSLAHLTPTDDYEFPAILSTKHCKTE